MDWKGFAAGISLTAIGVCILRYALMPPKKVHKPRPEQAASNDSLQVKIQSSADTKAGYRIVSERLDLWNKELLAATKQDTYRFGAPESIPNSAMQRGKLVVTACKKGS